jgi:hypothetical protein
LAFAARRASTSATSARATCSPRQRSHLCTTLHAFLVTRCSKYTGVRENYFSAPGASHLRVLDRKVGDLHALHLRCAWSFRQRPPGKDWRFPSKLLTSVPIYLNAS